MPKKLSKREKYSLYLAAGFIVLFVTIQFIVFPVIDKKKQHKRALQVKMGTLNEMLLLKSKYDTIIKKSAMAQALFDQREKGFTLFSFLDKLAGEAGLKDKIVYMKPSTSMQKDTKYKTSTVEMKLQAINLNQLTTYLFYIETSKNMVFIKRVSISKTDKDLGLINAVLNVETSET